MSQTNFKYRSGKTGLLQIGASTMLGLTFCEVRYGAEPQPFFPHATSPAQAAVAGPESGSGTFRIAVDENDPPLSSGAAGNQDPSSFVAGTGFFRTGDEVSLTILTADGSSVKAFGDAIVGEIQGPTIDKSGPVQELTYSFTCSNRWTIY